MLKDSDLSHHVICNVFPKPKSSLIIEYVVDGKCSGFDSRGIGEEAELRVTAG